MYCKLLGLSSARLQASATTFLIVAVITFAGPAAGQVFYTVGEYDEPTQTNAVDFVATGSTLNFAQFKEDVATAFANNFGGVNQCYSISLDSGPYNFSYGISQAKRLNMTGPTNNQIGIGANSSHIQSISGISRWSSSRPEVTFFLQDVASDVANEAVIEFGLTILSTSLFSMGEVTGTATFSDGAKVSASRFISEAAGQGDTFFGFAAPNGQSIASVTFTNSAGRSMFIDDIGFITASVVPLAIRKVGSSQVCFSWPTNAVGFSLEFTTDLSTQAWTSNTNTPVIIGNQFTVTVDSTAGQRFYRLHSP